MPEKVFVRSIPDELWRAFKARASLDGMTISQALQEAIRDYLAGSSRQGPSSVDPFHGLIGLAESGHSDVSESTDAYLASSVADSVKE